MIMNWKDLVGSGGGLIIKALSRIAGHQSQKSNPRPPESKIEVLTTD